MQETLLTIVVFAVLLVGFPWMTTHLTFNQQMAASLVITLLPLVAMLLRDWLIPPS